MKKHTLVSLVAMSLVTPTSWAQQNEDPYVAGFERWAEEVSWQDDGVMSDAAQTYAKEASSTIRQAGYIGKTLPLPKAVKVAEGVYTVVGSQIWHNPSNFGFNNNISFVIFEEGVFVFNTGANPAISYSVHQQIKQITDKPVKWVAVENNQGHAYFGASYWVDIGVKNFYSSDMANGQFDVGFERAKAEWSERVGKALMNDIRNVSDKFTTFDSEMKIDVGGGEYLHLIDFGPGHTPASTSVYIPSRKLLLAGDLAFNERMPVMFTYTNSIAWMESFEAMMATIPKDTKVIPGHGTPTDMATLKKQTYDYFRYVQAQVQKVVDEGGDLEAAENVDQSMYKDRPVFDQAAKNNARKIYYEITGGVF